MKTLLLRTAAHLIAAGTILGSVATEAKPYQEPKLVAVVKAQRPALPAGPTPTIAILSPPELDVIANKLIERRPKDGFAYYEVAPVDPKEVQLKLDVKNWKVAPGGPGVVLVLDNSFATELHDLSKPLDILKVFDVRTPQNPHGQLEDGWHFLAAFPVTADGIAVDSPGALAVAHFFWGHDPSSVSIGPSDFKGQAQIVVNRASVGTMLHRSSDGSLGGRLIRDPQHTPVDLLVWFPPGAPRDCVVPLRMTNNDASDEPITSNGKKDLDPTTTTKVKAPGLYFLSNLNQDRFTEAASIDVNMMECPEFTQVPIGDWDGAAMRFFLK